MNYTRMTPLVWFIRRGPPVAENGARESCPKALAVMPPEYPGLRGRDAAGLVTPSTLPMAAKPGTCQGPLASGEVAGPGVCMVDRGQQSFRRHTGPAGARVGLAVAGEEGFEVVGDAVVVVLVEVAVAVEGERDGGVPGAD